MRQLLSLCTRVALRNPSAVVVDFCAALLSLYIRVELQLLLPVAPSTFIFASCAALLALCIRVALSSLLSLALSAVIVALILRSSSCRLLLPSFRFVPLPPFLDVGVLHSSRDVVSPLFHRQSHHANRSPYWRLNTSG